MDLETSSWHGANRIYELCGALKLVTHPVSNPTLQELHRACRALRSGLSDSDITNETPWSRFLPNIRHVLFCLHVAPVLPGAPRLKYKERLVKCRDDLEKYQRVYPNFFGAATSLVSGLEEYLKANQHPMLTSVLEICERAEGKSIAILARPNHVEVTEESIRRVSSLKNVSVIGVQNLRSSNQFWDVLIIPGPQKDTYREFPPRHVVESPRSGEIHFLFHDNFQFQWNPKRRPIFEGGVPAEGSFDTEEENPRYFWGEFSQPRSLGTDVPIGPDEEFEVTSPELNLQNFALGSSGRGSQSDIDAVAANIVFLAGDKFVLVDPDAPHHRLRFHQDDSFEVDSAHLQDMDEESYLVLRGEGGGTDYIVSLADRLLGSRKKTCRAAQAGWKAGLRSIVHRIGLEETGERLRRHGLDIARPQNIRNWISSSSRKIGPQKFEDFEIIMQMVDQERLIEHTVGNQDEVSGTPHDYWTLLRELRKAHIAAGREMRKMLLKHLQALQALELFRLQAQGWMEVAMDDIDVGTLVIYRFLGVEQTEVYVEPSHIGQLQDLGDT